jgi:hypothetical protein
MYICYFQEFGGVGDVLSVVFVLDMQWTVIHAEVFVSEIGIVKQFLSTQYIIERHGFIIHIKIFLLKSTNLSLNGFITTKENRKNSFGFAYIIWHVCGVLESPQIGSKKKCGLLNFGCHLLQNSLLGNVYRDSIILFHVSKAPWKSFFFSFMLLSTACDSLWMSDTVSKCRSSTSIFNLGNKMKSQGANSSE